MLAAMSPPAENQPIRVLLWAPKGSGTHYYGPGSFFYRMYGRAAPGTFEITLAHAFGEQQRHKLFKDQYFIGKRSPYQSSRVSSYFAMRSFLKNARVFLEANHKQFDIFHGLSGFQPIIEPAYEAQKLGLPAVVFLANYRLDLSDKGGVSSLLGITRKRRAMAKQLSAVVAMSQAMYDELMEYDFPPERIARIPMGVDMSRFCPASDSNMRKRLREQLNWPEAPTLLFLGSVIERKQPHLLIEAIGLLHNRGVDCQLVIAGPLQQQEYAEQMKARVRELGIDDRVIWAGFVEDPVPLLQAADIYSLPSKTEGMPAAVVEAMACGLPAVATRISGITDLIDDGKNGRIIEPNAQMIADALDTYVKDDALRREHGDRARQTVERRYSTDFVLNAYEKLFRTILAGGNAADWESYK